VLAVRYSYKTDGCMWAFYDRVNGFHPVAAFNILFDFCSNHRELYVSMRGIVNFLNASCRCKFETKTN
jgi:hypothetical protein